jgi:hypothetical protein
MSVFDRLLEPGSVEQPPCRCGGDMELMGTEPIRTQDAEVRVYQCPSCKNVLRLTVWVENIEPSD